MATISNIQRVYGPLLDKFVRELAKYPYDDYAGVPHPFFPEVGRNYDHALKRIAIVGKETRGWDPNLDRFIPDYLSNGFDFSKEMAEFRNMDFKNSSWMGGRPTRASFWGFWMNVIAKIYGVQDWTEIRDGKFDILLDSFAWGNANAIETATSHGVNPGAPGYLRAKRLAEQKFDSIDLLEKALAPHVVILLCSLGERKRYLGDGFSVVEVVEGRVSVLQRDGLFVFHAPHPNNQRQRYPGGADVFARIMRDLLARYNLFCPLPDVFHKGLIQDSKQILITECAGISKFDAIAKVALELRRQHSYMTARSLCLDVLNPAGHKTEYGTPYTGNTKGPCRLVSTAWSHFQHNENRPDIAEKIALSFTDMKGEYAYRKCQGG